jgi:hypothetical protein
MSLLLADSQALSLLYVLGIPVGMLVVVVVVCYGIYRVLSRS